jgi:intracellular septation protein A
MFKQVIYEAWLDWVPFVAFGVTALVFLTFVIRAISLNKERARDLSRLPLDE